MSSCFLRPGNCEVDGKLHSVEISHRIELCAHPGDRPGRSNVFRGARSGGRLTKNSPRVLRGLRRIPRRTHRQQGLCYGIVGHGPQNIFVYASGLLRFAPLEIERRFLAQVAQSVGIVRRPQLRIIAGADAQELIGHELSLAALDLYLHDRSCDNIRPGSLDDLVADADCGPERLVDAFEPRCHVYSISHHRVAQALARTDIADEDICAMQPDPKLQRRPSLRAPFGIELLHPTRSAYRATTSAEYVVVPMRRSAPERHDAVADKLVDRTVLLRDGLRHDLEIARKLRKQIVRRHLLR